MTAAATALNIIEDAYQAEATREEWDAIAAAAWGDADAEEAYGVRHFEVSTALIERLREAGVGVLEYTEEGAIMAFGEENDPVGVWPFKKITSSGQEHFIGRSYDEIIAAYAEALAEAAA